mgnify:CR=1 FL=1|tara:strand:+ start:1851 stop:2318 length:468 start_codon:yes stop_codon:yes gene_type:complete
MVEPTSDRRIVFRGVVSLALNDGNLTFGEKRLITKLARALRLGNEEPKMIYESIIEGKNIEKGLELTNSEKISTYEQVLETFLIHTNKTDDELKIIAYLRKVFELSDSEHRAILRSLDRQLEEIVHRNVRQNIRYELKETMERLSEIVDNIRVQK